MTHVPASHNNQDLTLYRPSKHGVAVWVCPCCYRSWPRFAFVELACDECRRICVSATLTFWPLAVESPDPLRELLVEGEKP